MDLRTYRAKSLAEALRLVREDLGPDASLLHTRRMTGDTWSWLVGGPQIEVTASSEVQAPAILADQVDPPPRADLLDFRSQFREHLQRENRRRSVEELTRGASRSSSEEAAQLDHIGTLLMQQKFDGDTVRQFIDELHAAVHHGGSSLGRLCNHLVKLVEGRISIAGPIQLLPASRRVVALVGPTGVGKTTTVAKMAAGFQAQGKRVGLIAADTVRVAAVDQLRTYAEVLQLPMEVVAAGEAFGQAIERLKDTDLAIIDTGGCSPRDDERMQRLVEWLRRGAIDEVHLVQSAASAPDSIALVTKCFGVLRPRTLILTKFDEVATPGTLWPLISNRQLPLSYITDGQNVPQDIATANRQQLAAFLLGADITKSALR